MVPALVILTVLAFLAVDWFFFHRRRVEAAGDADEGVPAAVIARGTPTRLYWHPGHAWVRLARDGTALIGADSFAWSFLGEPAAVELPARGKRLRQGAPAWTLVSRRGRRLPQVMPVEGEIVETNPVVTTMPDDPLAGDSWLLKVRPRHLATCLSNLLRGDLAQSWRDAVKSHVTTRVAPSLGAVATDGGELEVTFGDRLDDEAWEALCGDLFPAALFVAPSDSDSD